MHVLEGTISNEVCLGAGVVSAAAVGYSLHRLKDSLADRTVPITGMMAALVFAGQMVNFPLIGAPVSGHLIGGVLAAVILGPWAGCVAMTLVLIVQCFLFSDGGLIALGVNVLNMGVVGSLGGYAVYAAIRRWLGDGPRGTLVGVVVASWLSVMAAAALFCLEFGLSYGHLGEWNPARVFALMVTVHSAIGVGESLIAGSVIAFVLVQRPELVHTPDHSTESRLLPATARRTAAAGVVCALAVAAFLSPFASEFDDGLVSVSRRLGFDRLEIERVMLFADYDQVIPGWQKLSVSLAGILGTLSVLVIAVLLDRSLKMRLSMADVKNE